MAHILLYFLALFSLSTSANWAKLNQMPVEILGFYRLGISALVVALWAFFLQRKKWPKMNSKILWVILSGTFFFLHLWTYKFAAKSTSVANTMILFETNPIWATLGGILFFREKLTQRLIFCYLLALTGIAILFWHQIDFSSLTFKGDVSALFSGFFYATYMLTGKQARNFYDNTVYATIQYFICGLLFFIAALFTGREFTGYSSTSWVSVVGLVMMPTLLGHFTFTYLVKSMNLSLMSCGKLIEPIFASLLAYFIFREAIKPAAWVAFALTGCSVIVLFAPDIWKARKRTNEES